MKKMIIAALLAVFAASGALALEPTLKAQAEAKLMDAFGPQLKVRDVEKLANKQLLEVVLIDGSIVYMTPDLNFFIYSDSLYELAKAGPINVTESRLNPKRVEAMSKITDAETVKFAAKGKEKAVIDVFTDIECPYCQKLHNEVPRLNELGVTVRYLAYPRAGINNPQNGQKTTSYLKINHVWCAKDRATEMTRMKAAQHDLGTLGQQLRQGAGSVVEAQYSKVEQTMAEAMAKATCSSPVEQQFELGHTVGVTGTPAIIAPDGSLIPGYMPADALAQRLGIN